MKGQCEQISADKEAKNNARLKINTCGLLADIIMKTFAWHSMFPQGPQDKDNALNAS